MEGTADALDTTRARLAGTWPGRTVRADVRPGEENELVDMDMSEIRSVVEQIKPAHPRFIISGLTCADVEGVELTWQWFEDNPTTWAEFECTHAI